VYFLCRSHPALFACQSTNMQKLPSVLEYFDQYLTQNIRTVPQPPHRLPHSLMEIRFLHMWNAAHAFSANAHWTFGVMNAVTVPEVVAAASRMLAR
jgi:hypothetical protein